MNEKTHSNDLDVNAMSPHAQRGNINEAGKISPQVNFILITSQLDMETTREERRR